MVFTRGLAANLYKMTKQKSKIFLDFTKIICYNEGTKNKKGIDKYDYV